MKENSTECAELSGAPAEGVVDEQGAARAPGKWSLEGGKDEEQEQRRQAEQGLEQSKQGEHMHFGEEQHLEKTEAENAGEPEVMGRTTEVRTGRGHAGLVPGEDESRGLNKTSGKGKGKGNVGKGEHEGKGGGFGRKGFQQSVREKEGEWGRVAPNMGGRWLTPPGHVGSRKGRKGEERDTNAELGRLQ